MLCQGGEIVIDHPQAVVGEVVQHKNGVPVGDAPGVQGLPQGHAPAQIHVAHIGGVAVSVGAVQGDYRQGMPQTLQAL